METTLNYKPRPGAWQYAASALAIVLVLGASIALRLYPTLTSPSLERMIESPVLVEHDSYYYLRYAKEYCSGAYVAGVHDALRESEHDLLRSRLPLPSAMACMAHKVFGISIEQAAMFLPLLLSALVCIPLWLYRGRMGGDIAAVVAIVFTLTSPIYIVRTKAGFFDTDCLNVFFMLAVAALVHYSVRTQGWRGVLYAALGGLVFRLFMWWYDKPVLYWVFAVIFAVMAAVYFKDGGGWRAGIVKLIVFMAVGYTFLGGGVFKYFSSYLSVNVLKAGVVGSLPNVASTVSELARESFRLSFNRLHTEVLAAAALAGVVWFGVSRWKDAAALLPLAAFGVMGFGGGARYLIYLVPVMGIGLGYLTVRLSEIAASRLSAWTRTARALPVTAGAAISIVLALATPRGVHAYIPVFGPSTHEALMFLKTQPKGIVWSWWDLGYAIEEVSGHAAYIDGGNNANAYYVAHSLVQSTPRETYDVIRNVLEAQSRAARSQGRAIAAPVIERPVYLVFTSEMIDLYTWIQYFGNWDLARGTGDMERQKRWRLGRFPAAGLSGRVKGADSAFDLSDGTLSFQGSKFSLEALYTVHDDRSREPVFRRYPYGGGSGLIIEVIVHGDYAEVFLAERDFYESVFNRMFLLGEYDPALFELVYDSSTSARIYRLRQASTK